MKIFQVFYQDRDFLIKAEEIEICSEGSIFYIKGEVVAVFPISAGVIKYNNNKQNEYESRNIR